MASVRFTDVQARPMEFLDLTSVTLAPRNPPCPRASGIGSPPDSWSAATRAGARALPRLAGFATLTSHTTVAHRALAQRRTGASPTEKSNTHAL